MAPEPAPAIPVNEPLLDGREKKYLAECIDTGWVSADGPFIRRFEEAFAARVQAPHGIAVASGTAALETALYAVGVGAGDEVLMPSYTIISCAIAALRLGAKPVVVDVEPDTWCLDPKQVEAKIGPKTKALMPVHMWGHPADMDPILAIARRRGLKVVEDACQAHGAEYKGRRCGSLGDAAAFSFYANKIITTGEGGMVTAADPAVMERARSYRNLCFKPERRFFHTELGYNFRMSNVQAAVGLAQTERLDEFVEIKRRQARLYRELLGKIPGLRTATERPDARCVYWMHVVELGDRIPLDAVAAMKKLGERGIATRPFFLGLHEQPALHDLGLLKGETHPVTERAYRRGFYLPSGMTLTEAQIRRVCGEMESICRGGAA
jgi:perosamine synthetase